MYCIRKSNGIIMRLKFGIKYLSKTERILFFVSSIIGGIGGVIVNVFSRDSILFGVGQSVIAAYVFYIFLDFFPQLFRSYNVSYQEKIVYDFLRMMLLRLDELFILPFQQVHTNRKLPPLKVFFSDEFLRSFILNFDSSTAHSNTEMYNPNGNHIEIPFIQYIRQKWNETQNYIRQLIIIPYVNENNELFYQLKYLNFNSWISQYFTLIHTFQGDTINTPQGASRLPYYLLIGYHYNMDGGNKVVFDKTTAENIIKLHELAFEMYKRLNGDPRWDTHYPPVFYNESN